MDSDPPLDPMSLPAVAYFQPIVAIDNPSSIYSFEALGRYADAGGMTRSLGSFFANPAVPAREAFLMDLRVRRDALRRFAEEGRGDEFLFLNFRLEWIANRREHSGKPSTLQLAEEFGIDPRRLVIEITEEDFSHPNADYDQLLAAYRRFGLRIAIDDFGENASNLERLAQVRPDILKLDREYIRKSEDSPYYRDYLESITAFAERMGIETLYEGIETEKQLAACIAAKGRYYQGFLLGRPQPSLRGAVTNQEILTRTADKLNSASRERRALLCALCRTWDDLVAQFLAREPVEAAGEDLDAKFSRFFSRLSPSVKRVFLCDSRGVQLSRNIERGAEGTILLDYRRRNWAWRGFFQEAMEFFASGGKSYLTNDYLDAATKEKIYTYVNIIGENLYLFIDIRDFGESKTLTGRLG